MRKQINCDSYGFYGILFDAYFEILYSKKQRVTDNDNAETFYPEIAHSGWYWSKREETIEPDLFFEQMSELSGNLCYTIIHGVEEYCQNNMDTE